MKDKITIFFLIVSGLVLFAYICLFFMPEERKVIEGFFKKDIKTVKQTSYKNKLKNYTKDVKENKLKKVEEEVTSTLQLPDDLLPSSSTISVKVNKPTDYNYKTKQEIYDIRKSYVSQSPFYYEGYEPSDDIIGQVEDGLPWISNTFCIYKRDNATNIRGASEEARFLNNPTALVMIDDPFPPYWCEYIPQSAKFNFYPQKINYDPEKNIIYVKYNKIPHVYKERRQFYDFKGINAIDFGYRYAYLDPQKSTFVPDFAEERNISNSVIEFQDFIHRGGSCKVKGDCNNGSPKQDYLLFYYTKRNIKPNQYMYIKLWKERPQSPEDKADMIEIIELSETE